MSQNNSILWDLTDDLVQTPCLTNEKTNFERGKMAYGSSHRE